MWVRTRGLREFESQCKCLFCIFFLNHILTRQKSIFPKLKGHFASRPLPSNGLIPFVRTYICELNYSCYATPRTDPKLDIQLTQLSQMAAQSLSILNQNDTINSLTNLADFANLILKQRLQASQLTSTHFNQKFSFW